MAALACARPLPLASARWTYTLALLAGRCRPGVGGRLDAWTVAFEALVEGDRISKAIPRGYGKLKDQLARALQGAFTLTSEAAARTGDDRACRFRWARAEGGSRRHRQALEAQCDADATGDAQALKLGSPGAPAAQAGERRVVRRLYLCSEMTGFHDWEHLRTVLRVSSQTFEHGTLTKDENRYLLCSLGPDRLSPEQWLKLVRQYWMVENGTHWKRQLERLKVTLYAALDSDLVELRVRIPGPAAARCSQPAAG